MFLIALIVAVSASSAEAGTQRWEKQVIYQGGGTATSVAADFTGDGRVDVISNDRNTTRLFVAPDWSEHVLHVGPGKNWIHSEVMDVDGDGDMDYIATRYQPGLIVWLECPASPLVEVWPYHVIDEEVDGIHGLLVGDVNNDGQPDLLANSAQPKGKFPNSLVWYSVHRQEGQPPKWSRHVLADNDAPGLSHYLGLGDLNNDGRPDATSAAKGGPQAVPNTGDWFAWWEAPKDPTEVWKKHLIAGDQAGATNIHPADVNGDGQVDVIASCGHGNGVWWFEAPHWKRHAINSSLVGPHCLVVADLDNDGDLDAATCAKDDKKAAWFANDGKGTFTTHIIGVDQAAYDIRAVDMEGDGDLDLLVAGQQSQNVVWYVNPLKSKP